MNGMTGYSFKEYYEDDLYFSTEVKTVNHRYLDINVHLPQYLNSLELKVRDLVKNKLSRGKVDVNIYLRLNNPGYTVEPNFTVASQYVESFQKLSDYFGLQDSVKLFHLTRCEDIFIVEKREDYSKYWDVIEKGLAINLDEVVDMRLREGESTKNNILAINKDIFENTLKIAGFVPEMEKLLFNKLKERLDNLVGDRIDENKLLIEAGVLVNKTAINEEVERLKFHTSQLEKVACEDADIGKRMDFICQEMNREINTIGSKVALASISEYVVKVKNDIEKIREQLRNIE